MKLRLTMPLVLLFLFLFLSASTVHAQINGGMSGSLFIPDNDGAGLSFEILSDSFGIANWYTYDLEVKQR